MEDRQMIEKIQELDRELDGVNKKKKVIKRIMFCSVGVLVLIAGVIICLKIRKEYEKEMKGYYTNGIELYAKGKYDDSINSLNNVGKLFSDKYYDKAQRMIMIDMIKLDEYEEAMDKFSEDKDISIWIDICEDCTQTEDYWTVFDICIALVEGGNLTDREKINDLYNKCKKQYIDYIERRVKEQCSENRYQKALTIVKTAKEKISDSRLDDIENTIIESMR